MPAAQLTTRRSTRTGKEWALRAVSELLHVAAAERERAGASGADGGADALSWPSARAGQALTLLAVRRARDESQSRNC